MFAFLAEERHMANWSHRPDGPLAADAQARFDKLVTSIPVDTDWDTAAYGDPDVPRPGPPELGVDSTELTDTRYGYRLADVMIPHDNIVSDPGCAFLEIRRHLEQCPVPQEPGHPHWEYDYGDYFTTYGQRRNETGANEMGPYIESECHRGWQLKAHFIPWDPRARDVLELSRVPESGFPDASKKPPLRKLPD